MFDARRRQLGWLFFLLLVGISHGQGPATTVVTMLCFGLRIEVIRWKKRIFNEASMTGY